jgi:two-component system OmpR family sensor kinase
MRPAGFRLPILVQVGLLLVVTLVVVQLMTVLIVGMVPMPRGPMYRLVDVAAALRGAARPEQRLVRKVEDGSFPLAGPGRPEDENARRAIAALLGVPESQVHFTTLRRPSLFEQMFRRMPGRPGFGGPPPGFNPRMPQPEPAPGVRGYWPPYLHPDWPIFGDFTAALQSGPGHWVVLRPKPEPFPTQLQRLIGLWLLCCLLLVTPPAYLFARYMTAPIDSFARAAEALGRDPHAPPMAPDGPLEIARAAAAFNRMQARLQRFVEDRTAMIGAISHDLRTPLSRIRFRMERDPVAARAAILADIAQMDAMISSVLDFIRDGAAPGRRQLLELRSLLECAVDAAALCADVGIEDGPALYVHGDELALTRMFSNLIDNAVRYGMVARLRAYSEDGEAVIEIQDDGPGIAPADLERVFAPFFRADAARNLDIGGVGLGLSVARSIARAHGGDIILDQRPRAGLKVVARLPLERAAAPEVIPLEAV